MKNIAVVIYPQALASSIGLAVEMLNAAGELRRVATPHAKPLRITTVQVVPPTQVSPANTRLCGGLSLHAEQRLEDVGKTDLVILPALWRNPQTALKQQAALLPWLRQQAEAGARLAAAGTASCFLAAAGLLDDKPATTHWAYFDEFEKRYPRAQLQRRHLITQAGNLYCVGSVNSIADLMVHFISESFGEKIARRVESQFSPEIRQSYAKHLYAATGTHAHADEDIMQTQYFLQSNYQDAIDMAALAQQNGFAIRTFNRRFKLATGLTPVDYLQQRRLQAATSLLRDSNLTVAEIGQQVGYSDASYFTRLFRRKFSMTPQKYRESVRGKLFAPG